MTESALAQPSDEELVARLRAGDVNALGDVYDRYSTPLLTFAYSMLRSRDRAADATHDAFVAAAGKVGQLRDPSRLRPWLYAIVRSECLKSLRGAKRETVFEEWHDPGEDGDVDKQLNRDEVARLVRSAMDGMSEKDREVIALSLQHDLDNGEMAAVLGVKPSHVTALTSRARKSLEQSLGALLVAEAGGEGCDELTELLSTWDGQFSPLWRKRINKHIDGCPNCAEERRRRFSPAAILPSVPLIVPPAALREQTLHDAEPELVAHAAGGGAEPSSKAGHHTTRIDGTVAWDFPESQSRRGLLLWSGAAVAVLVLAVGWLFFLRGEQPGEPQRVVDTQVVVPSTSAPTEVPAETTRPDVPGPRPEDPVAPRPQQPVDSEPESPEEPAEEPQTKQDPDAEVPADPSPGPGIRVPRGPIVTYIPPPPPPPPVIN